MIANENELRILKNISNLLQTLSNPIALDDRVIRSMVISFRRELKGIIKDAQKTSD